MVAVPGGDRLAQLRQPAERRVPVGGLVGRIARERLDHVRRRAGLRVPAPEIDERLAVRGCGRGDAREQRPEVLLGQPLDSRRPDPHRARS